MYKYKAKSMYCFQFAHKSGGGGGGVILDIYCKNIKDIFMRNS
jgi:hypothetical protein